MADEPLPYRDARVPLEARLDDLLARMTLEEKVAQLYSHGRVSRCNQRFSHRRGRSTG